MKQRTSTSAVSVQHIPSGVWGMAFTELWERFSFYGLNGILSFYLLFSLADGGLNLNPASASGIVGAYGGAVYLTQLAGAWLGERVMSPKWLVFWGGVIITAGHIALAVLPNISGLAIGLVLVVIGTGALKVNITSIVGFVLDGQSEAKRDVGFAYFYISITLGAVIGPLSTGFVQSTAGFHWGFALAAVGMVPALIQYLVSMRKLPAQAGVVTRPIAPKRFAWIVAVAFGIAAALTWLLASGAVRPEQLAVITVVVALCAAGLYFVGMLLARNVTADEKRRVAAYLPLFLTAGVFFGLLFQQNTTIAILVSERVDLSLGGWSMPVGWIAMISPLATVLITPIIARFWGRSGNDGTGAPQKFSFGLGPIGIAYALLLILVLAIPDSRIHILWIVLVLLIAGTAEIFVGPVSLSLATRIGPRAFRSQLVGLNFLTLSLGASLSGVLGQLYTVVPETAYFVLTSSLGLGLAVLLWVLRKRLHRALQAGL